MHAMWRAVVLGRDGRTHGRHDLERRAPLRVERTRVRDQEQERDRATEPPHGLETVTDAEEYVERLCRL